jgi:hypothetical protein
MRTTTPGINAAFTCPSGTPQVSCIVWTVVLQQLDFIRIGVGNIEDVFTDIDRNLTKVISKPDLD